MANAYHCRYLLNSEQIGPAVSRHRGLRIAQTENVILLDAHMRFYANDWHEGVNAAIDESPESLFCTYSVEKVFVIVSFPAQGLISGH